MGHAALHIIRTLYNNSLASNSDGQLL